MDSSFEAFSVKAVQAAMTIPALILQKPHAKSTARHHTSCLHKRLAL